jgi:hypothetical protein
MSALSPQNVRRAPGLPATQAWVGNVRPLEIAPTGRFAANLADIEQGHSVAPFGCRPVGQFPIVSAIIETKIRQHQERVTPEVNRHGQQRVAGDAPAQVTTWVVQARREASRCIVGHCRTRARQCVSGS